MRCHMVLDLCHTGLSQGQTSTVLVVMHFSCRFILYSRIELMENTAVNRASNIHPFQKPVSYNYLVSNVQGVGKEKRAKNGKEP